jgi:putative nucleotidyltransferase with HDIG domain
MGLLDMLGLKKKGPRPVGQDLESGRDDVAKRARTKWLLRAGLFVVLLVATVGAFPRGEVFEYTVQVGDTWRQPTLVAPFNFPVYKDPETVQQERAAARARTPAFFAVVPGAQQRMAANRDTLQQQLDRVFDAYAAFRYHEMRGQIQEAREDSVRYRQLRQAAQLTLSQEQWRRLVQAYVDRLPSLSRTSRRPAGDSRLEDRLLGAAYEVGAQLLGYGNGVLDLPLDSLATNELILRNERERTQRRVAVETVFGINEAYDAAERQLRKTFADEPSLASLALAIFRDIFVPSLRYQRAETERERQRRAQSVSPIRGGVQKGEVIVQQGQRVTEEIKRKLTSFERVKNESNARPILWRQLGGEGLLMLGVYGLFFLYLYLIRRDVFRNDRSMLIIGLLFLTIVALFGVAVRIPWANLYAVPVALAAVLLTIVFNSTIGLLGTLTLALAGGAMLGLDLEFALATLVGGALGVFSVRDIKNRGQFVVSALLVFVGYALVLVASWLYLGAPFERLGEETVFAAVGASFTIVAGLVLWGIERAFDITTDLTLLELSDTNRPLLKELSLKAPGSFNHSLQVANLAEAAADRIGANALLTRVGALYHDIGKMRKPQYFVENQRGGVNPHDKLKPRMSALIIAAHVKEGLEMARSSDYNLPKQVRHFIPTHHGTSRIEYFYRQAVEQRGEEEAPVLESEFRYPGPKPDSKETGILMLADSIEAASRSLDEPTHKRLKSLIDLIVKERVEDGQLDDTDLTFRDLTQVKETFLSILMGIYHVRVKYPDQEETVEYKGPLESGAVALASEPGTWPEAASVMLMRDAWGGPVRGLASQTLHSVPGVHAPQAPRDNLAQASPHAEEAPADVPPVPTGDGVAAAEAPDASTSEATTTEASNSDDDLPDDAHELAPEDQRDGTYGQTSRGGEDEERT